MKSKASLWLLAGLVGLLAVLAGCASERVAPTPTEQQPAARTPLPPGTATPTPGGQMIPEQLKPAWEAVAQAANLPSEQVTIEEFTAVEWSDSCLGAARPDEMCLQVITPGFRAVFGIPQGQVVVHTNTNGQVFRIVSGLDP